MSDRSSPMPLPSRSFDALETLGHMAAVGVSAAVWGWIVWRLFAG